jgi:hypothetical protein
MSAYTIEFDDTQIGDEMFKYLATPIAQPPVITPLFGSPVAAVRRRTVALRWRIEVSVVFQRATPHATAAAIAALSPLLDSEPEKITIDWQNGSVTEIDDALLETIEPSMPEEPAIARTVMVALVFTATSAPTLIESSEEGSVPEESSA